MLEKPGRKKGFDPKKRKSKDDASRTTRRHKIARSAARKIKAHANQTVRRAGKIAVREAIDIDEAADTTPRLAKRKKPKVWPAANAAKRREMRACERAYLDETSGTGPKGAPARVGYACRLEPENKE